MIFALIWYVPTGDACLQIAKTTKNPVAYYHRVLCYLAEVSSAPLLILCAESAHGNRRYLKLAAIFGNGAP